MPSANCTDRLWLTAIVSAAVTKWMIDAQKVPDAGHFDQTKKFSDYGMNFANFNQLCADITPTINQTLHNEPCNERLTLPDDWRQKHQGDVITAFISAVVDQILKPATAVAATKHSPTG